MSGNTAKAFTYTSAYKPWGQPHTEAQHLGVDKQQQSTYDTRALQFQSRGHLLTALRIDLV